MTCEKVGDLGTCLSKVFKNRVHIGTAERADRTLILEKLINNQNKIKVDVDMNCDTISKYMQGKTYKEITNVV